MIKKFIRKLIESKKLIFGYPECAYGEKFGVDYDKYWHKRRKIDNGKSTLSLWQKQRADYVLNIIEKGSTVLDVGCGDGAVLSYLKEKANIRGIGVDISEAVMEQAKQLGIETIKLDINNFEELENLPQVDYITGFEIIEHMPVPEEFIYHISKKARKGLIFSVPNTGYYAHRLRLLFGKFPLQWAAHPGEHLRFWTVKDMKFWVNSIGFKMENFILYEGLPVLNKIWPNMYAQGIIIHIKNKD